MLSTNGLIQITKKLIETLTTMQHSACSWQALASHKCSLRGFHLLHNWMMIFDLFKAHLSCKSDLLYNAHHTKGCNQDNSPGVPRGLHSVDEGVLAEIVCACVQKLLPEPSDSCTHLDVASQGAPAALCLRQLCTLAKLESDCFVVATMIL